MQRVGLRLLPGYFDPRWGGGIAMKGRSFRVLGRKSISFSFRVANVHFSFEDSKAPSAKSPINSKMLTQRDPLPLAGLYSTYSNITKP